MASLSTLDKEPDPLIGIDRGASSRSAQASASASATPGPSGHEAGGYAGLNWETMPWYLKDSSSDTSRSDDDFEYLTADEIISVEGEVEEEPEGGSAAVEDGLFPGIPEVPNWSTGCGIGEGLADGLFQQATGSRNSNSLSSSPSGSGDMDALMGPNRSPKVVVVLQGREDQWHRTPPLVASSMLEPVIEDIRDSLGDNLY